MSNLYNPYSGYAYDDDETLKRENGKNGASMTKIWYSLILKQDKTTWGNRIWYKSDFCLFSVPAQIRRKLDADRMGRYKKRWKSTVKDEISVASTRLMKRACVYEENFLVILARTVSCASVECFFARTDGKWYCVVRQPR